MIINITEPQLTGTEMEKTDPHFKDEIAEKIGLERIKPCYACSSCTSICPVREAVDDFDPRRLIHMIILGRRQELLSSELIWFCCFCNSCYFVCPQGIRFSRIAAELRNIAVAEEYVDDEFISRLAPVGAQLNKLCRRTMFNKVKEGLRGAQTMPCWHKDTGKNKE